MSVNDIYDDLPEFDIGSDVEKLKNENEILHQRILQLEEEVGNLSKTIVNLKKIQQNLATNISELYKTALNEINRKNQIISDLRTQVDNLVFKRQNNNDYNNRRVENYDRKRSRSPSNDKRSLKKFKNEHNHPNSYDRHHHRISPRKLINNRHKDDKSYYKHKSRERSSSREHSRDPRTRKDKEIVRNNDKKHEKIEILPKEKQNKVITNNIKENLENRNKQNDDNFLKTANSKGNIYKKELFQDKNLKINNNNNNNNTNKRSEKRKIEIVTKKLFDKAAEKTKQSLVESQKHEQKSKKKTVEVEKEVKVTTSKNDENKSVYDKTKLVANNLIHNKDRNGIKTIKQDCDRGIVEKSKINVKTELNTIQQSLENGKNRQLAILENIKEETNCQIIENQKEESKEPNNKGIDVVIKPDEKSPIKENIITKTLKQSPIKEKSDKQDSQTNENNQPTNDLSVEKEMNEMFNNPTTAVVTKADEETVEQMVKTQESPNKIDELNMKECVVQLKTNDILNVEEYKIDDKKRTPLKTNIDGNESKNPIGRVLRSATKKIIEEPPPIPTVKMIKTKRTRQRKNSAITSTVEIINDDIPVLHLIENAPLTTTTTTKCDNNLIELANIDLTNLSPIKEEIVTSTPHQQIEESPSSFHSRLSTPNNESTTSSTSDSFKSNQNSVIIKPKRRRCIIKMID